MDVVSLFCFGLRIERGIKTRSALVAAFRATPTRQIAQQPCLHAHPRHISFISIRMGCYTASSSRLMTLSHHPNTKAQHGPQHQNVHSLVPHHHRPRRRRMVPHDATHERPRPAQTDDTQQQRQLNNAATVSVAVCLFLQIRHPERNEVEPKDLLALRLPCGCDPVEPSHAKGPEANASGPSLCNQQHRYCGAGPRTTCTRLSTFRFR